MSGNFVKMPSNIATVRRLHVLLRTLHHGNRGYQPINIRACASDVKVSIGEISKSVKEATRPEYIPKKYYTKNTTQSSLHHLRWMMQKDLLGQDMFLIGPPGPRKRLLALQYLELTNRELEYVALNRDTTEADLKQRREIVSGTAKYFDQSAVRAAVQGRVLILEGIEKAERNVLPVLNNLLENREMHLEDGRLLIPANRYDQLLEEHSKEELEKWKLVRVSEDFRVIALGLPVPKYVGNPLDPPLRSRFQARDVCINSYQEYLLEMKNIAPSVAPEQLENLLSGAFGLLSPEGIALGLPDFPIDNVLSAARIMEQNPSLSTHNILYRLYPYKSFLNDGIAAVESLLSSLKVMPDPRSSNAGMRLNYESITNKLSNILTGEKPAPSSVANENDYIETSYQNQLINEMLQTYKVSDFCLIGPRGCGKNIVVSKLAEMVGKQIESIVLYQDMTSRDLIQQRTTLDTGDTVWRNSALVNAALEGKIALIDGIHRIHPSTLSVLHRLVHDRELQLHDGKRLISLERFESLLKEQSLTREQLNASGILPIHPAFKIIALAEPPVMNATGNWLSSEMLSLFLFHEMRTLSKTEEMNIITSKCGPISKPLHQLIDLAHVLRSSQDHTLHNLAGHLSTRQLLRIAMRMSKYPTNDIYDTIRATFMTKFLPTLTKEALENTVKKLGIRRTSVTQVPTINYKVENGICTIGNTSIPVYNTEALSKVPNVLFYDVPQHLALMEKLLQDFQLGSHLLLVGNQGVGKNKIIDRFLNLLNRPREYIQLHRDTTVQTLTIQPTVKDGLLIHEDSPLVKAIKLGHILVIDEADKAPTHVTCILKTLVESGEMILSDGRRIVKPSHVEHYDPATTIVTHPDFRMFILANRPGFPFLGNDFFGALGDLFSCHAVDNPTEDSEIELLKQYGPNVSEETIRKLVEVFDDLRTLADQGLVNYPYSTREVVNVVRHLEKFPNADVTEVIFNVFDFDRYSSDVVQTLAEVLDKHGFPAKDLLNVEWLAAKRAKDYLQVNVESKSGKDVSEPKHGKEDPNNDPHVGGNTWAGGTGGRDTAGLGGKGGPYRLDKGHKVHQLSDEEKNAVPEHVKQAAREMGRKAFAEKLKEIGMSGYDASLYNQFYSSVARQIQSLRVILGSLQAKNKERHWSRHQTSGELDDVKLIDGLLGEKTVYRRRTEQEPELGAPQMKPKRLRVVVDVSGSMYRFNSYDGRLDRELEAVVLVTEAFQGFEDKIKYDIMGHSGDAHDIKFVSIDDQPDNNMKRLDVMRIMHAHSQYCWTGDNTLQATQLAVESLAKEDCDEAIVVVLSDANLQRYGIPPSKLANALTAHPNVSAYVVFIGSLGDQAERLTQSLPSGRSFVCTDVSNLPQILKQIFSASVINI